MLGNLFRRVDVALVVPVFIIVVVSLTTLFSINFSFFRNQFIFFLLSIGVFLFFTQTDFSTWELYEKPLYIISLVGLLFLLFLGFESRGAVRWLDFFGYRLQFSEIFKPFLAISLTSFLARHGKPTGKLFGLVLLLLMPVVFLIFKQPDLGSALMYLLSTLLTLLLYGFSLWWFAGLAGGAIIFIPLAFKVLHGYQQQRILTFLGLIKDPLGTSYNAIQAIIAVGSGQLFGKGLGQGTQSALRFLPERHTDFIFATMSEDLGFLGAAVLIAAFFFLFYRLFVLFRDASSPAHKTFLAATFALFFVQFFVNIGMNIGLMPIVGVTLPFVSYGGSSLVSNAIFLGLASSIASLDRKNSVLEIR